MEYVDIVDENEVKTGQGLSIKDVHKKGLWHRSAGTLIFNNKLTKVLLSQRSKDNYYFPMQWDITASGHLSLGEAPLTCAKREFKEELGLDPKKYKFEFISTFQFQKKYKDILNNEFIHLYAIKESIPIDKIVLNDEINSVKWFTKEEIEEEKNYAFAEEIQEVILDILKEVE